MENATALFFACAAGIVFGILIATCLMALLCRGVSDNDARRNAESYQKNLNYRIATAEAAKCHAEGFQDLCEFLSFHAVATREQVSSQKARDHFRNESHKWNEIINDLKKAL